MGPQNNKFGGGVEQTFLSPIVLLAIVIAGVVICVSGRRKALAAFLTAVILIPPDQVLLLGSVHFPMLRILALFGLVRVLRSKYLKKEAIFTGGVTGIDKAIFALSLFLLIDGMLLWQVWAELVFQLGNLLIAFGTYFLLRFLIRDLEDVTYAIRVFAWVAAVVGLIMAYEKITGVNLLYSTLGGFRTEMGSVVVRDGHFRAAGPFGISILAGTFGGILLPLFIGLWFMNKKDRGYAAMGIAASTVISFSPSSSTALFGYIAGIVALCFWPLRRRMRMIRWGIVGALVSLHLYMKSPVWHLIADVDLTGGSSSYHRYQLVNQCILHFWDWFLVGTKNYEIWGWDMWDLCNQYAVYADQSGLIPLLCFVAIIVLGFSYLGKARRTAPDQRLQLFIWALGASLFANVVAFFGVSYWDQTIVAWYSLLAMIPATVISVRSSARDDAQRGLRDQVLAASLKGDRNDVEFPSFANTLTVASGLNGFGFPRENSE